jgi:hypothetical protein
LNNRQVPLQMARPPRRSHRRQFDLFWNFLTFLVVLGMIIVAAGVAIIYINPYSRLNPYPPQSLPKALMLATHTPTLISLPGTWTPTKAPSTPVPPTETPTPVTPTPTNIMGDLVLTETPTLDANANYSFALHGDISAIGAFILNPDRGCKWMGVGGQVFDLQGRPITGISVQMGGVLERQNILEMSLTGTALQYGSAGYEFTIADHPIASKGALWIRLVDQSRLPLSGKVYFDSFEDCTKNMVIINFKQVR